MQDQPADLPEDHEGGMDALREQLSGQYQEFIYAISHDIGGALRQVNAFLGLLERGHGHVLDAEGQEFLTFATQGGQRLDLMLSGLLQLSRVKTHSGERSWVSTEQLLRGAWDNALEGYPGLDAALEVGEAPQLWGQPEQLAGLLEELFRNALRFRRGDSPQVEVVAREHGGAVELLIRDYGIGFAPKYSDQVFLPFRSLHAPGDYPGVGMGLTIARRVAEHHGGSLTAAGVDGVGATFALLLPVPTRPLPS